MTSFLILDGLSQPITKNNNSRELIRHCVSLASFVRFTPVFITFGIAAQS
jgi:hypothetical protein